MADDSSNSFSEAGKAARKLVKAGLTATHTHDMKRVCPSRIPTHVRA